MTDEALNRKFDIVANHLATFAVGMQKLEEAQARAEVRLERAEGRLERGETRLDRAERVLGTAIRLGSRQMSEMREAINRLTEAQARTDVKLSETGGRLNILVNTVERYISERRNGSKGDNGQKGGG